jgi:hypothetical protein
MKSVSVQSPEQKCQMQGPTINIFVLAVNKSGFRLPCHAAALGSGQKFDNIMPTERYTQQLL